MSYFRIIWHHPSFWWGSWYSVWRVYLFVFCLSSCNDNAIRDMSLVLTDTVSFYHLLRFLYKTVWLDESILENELSFLFIAPKSLYFYQLVCLEKRYYYKEVIIIHTYPLYGKHSTCLEWKQGCSKICVLSVWIPTQTVFNSYVFQYWFYVQIMMILLHFYRYPIRQFISK